MEFIDQLKRSGILGKKTKLKKDISDAKKYCKYLKEQADYYDGCVDIHLKKGNDSRAAESLCYAEDFLIKSETQRQCAKQLREDYDAIYGSPTRPKGLLPFSTHIKRQTYLFETSVSEREEKDEYVANTQELIKLLDYKKVVNHSMLELHKPRSQAIPKLSQNLEQKLYARKVKIGLIKPEEKQKHNVSSNVRTYVAPKKVKAKRIREKNMHYKTK